MIQATLNKTDLKASICKDSFFEFFLEFWEVIEAEKLVLNWHIEYLANELQEIAERVFRNEKKKNDLIINVSPGTTKSMLCSVMFPAWIWTRFSHGRIIAGSYTEPLALDLSKKRRDLIQSDKYKEYFSEIELRRDQNQITHFQNTLGGWSRAVSVGGSITGFHAHFIIVDDPLDPKKAASEQELKNANDWIDKTLPSRKVNKEVTPTILIMQRLHQNDPTGHLMERVKDTIKHICLPASIADGEEVKPRILRRKYKDKLFDPVRLGKGVLEEMLAKLGQFAFAAQFKQKPIPDGTAMFMRDRVKFGKPPPLRHFEMLVRAWDKAGTEDAGAWTVGMLMGRYKNQYWILHVLRGQWSSEKREQNIQNTAKADGKEVYIVIEQEPGSGGKESAEGTVRSLSGYKVRVDRPTGSKVERADPFSVQWNWGNVYIKEGAEWANTLLDEFEFFPNSTNKDQVDSGSMGFNLLAKKKIVVGGAGAGKQQ